MRPFPFQYINLIIANYLLKSYSWEFYEYDKPEKLYAYLENITRFNPTTTSLIHLGISFENRPIYCLKISKGNESIGTIITEFGAHAREWVSHTSATHAIYELLHNDRYDDVIRQIAWYIIPLLNPDGYRYSRTKDRLWRKNRSPNFKLVQCFGVDVNRNFPVKWVYGRDQCDQSYGGPKPFSESESKAIERLFTLIPEGGVDVYLSVHSNAQCIILPYAYTQDHPKGYSTLYRVATKMKYAMERVGFPKYNIIQASQMYIARGTVFDWVYDHKGVPLVFTLELPFSGNDHKPFQANPPEKEVIAKQCLAALVACAMEITGVTIYNKPLEPVSIPTSNEPISTSNQSISTRNQSISTEPCKSEPIKKHTASANTITMSISLILAASIHTT